MEGGGIAVGVEFGVDAGIAADPEVGIAGAVEVGKDAEIGVNPKVGVEGEIASTEEVRVNVGIGVDPEVGVEGGIAVNPVDVDVGVFTKGVAEVAVEEDIEGEVCLQGGSEEEFDVNNESDDEFDGNSWNEYEEELSTNNEGYEVEDDIYDVYVGGDGEVDDDLYEVRIKEAEDGGLRGSSGQKPKLKHVDQRGFSDIEWESETLDSDTSEEDRDIYGNFGIFS